MTIDTLRRALFGFVIALLALVPGARAQDTITVGVIRAVPVAIWPLRIGMAEGMFAAAGVKIDLIEVVFATNIIQQVTAGSLDAGSVGLVEPVRAASKGAHVAIVRIEGSFPPFALLSKPAITSVKELKGKTVSLGGHSDSTVGYMIKMLKPAGLTIDDIDKVYAGSTADRFAQLKSGAVDAAMLLPPFIGLAEKGGFKNIAFTPDYVKDLPFSGYCVNVAWAEKHKATLRKFLSGYQKAVDWFYDLKNRDAAIKLAVDLSHGNEAVIAQTYDFFHKTNYFAHTARIKRVEIENLIALAQSLEPLDHPVKPEQLVLPGVTQLVK